jgi:hypothetical protein
MRLPDYETRSLSSYKHVDTQDQLAIAIHPLTEKQEIEQYFGMNLLSANILPVLVVAENNNPVSSFIVSKDRIFLKNTNQPDDSKRADRKDVTSPSSGEAMVITGSALWGVSSLVPALPALALASAAGAAAVSTGAAALLSAPVLQFAGKKRISDAEVIKHNLAVKELQTRTISPGKSIQGFVYFQVPKEAHPLRDWAILVKVVEINTSNVLSFEFNLH